MGQAEPTGGCRARADAEEAENKYQDVLSEVIKRPVFEEKINILQNFINANANSPSINKAKYEIEKYQKLIINREFQSTITKRP